MILQLKDIRLSYSNPRKTIQLIRLFITNPRKTIRLFITNIQKTFRLFITYPRKTIRLIRLFITIFRNTYRHFFTNNWKKRDALLRGINLNVEEGKILALIGGNGSGKTTLFNIISGFEKNYTGDVLLEDKKLRRFPAHHISLMGIGRLFQDGQLLSGLTLMENMKLASDNKTGEMPFSSLLWHKKYKEVEAAKEQQAKDILVRIFGEGNKYLDMLDRDASAFSYGEQRILSLARLLMGGNKLLLLDEPTSGVNPVYIDTIEQIIHEMKEQEGLTVLLIEHNMHFVRKVADTCAFLADGIIAKVGATADVLDDKNVRNSYLGL